MMNPSDYFIHLSIQQLLICKKCKYALKSKDVLKHLQRNHKTIPLITRRDLVEYARILILHDESTVMTPVGIISAFECLEMIEGHCCIVCKFLSNTSTGIKRHYRNVHGWNNNTARGEKLSSFLSK